MHKLPFTFEHNLKQRRVKNLQLFTEEVGKLRIVGTAYYSEVKDMWGKRDISVDVEMVIFEDTDIKAVLEACGALQNLEDACKNYVEHEINLITA